MPAIEAELKSLQAMAWNLQRNLDRLGSQSSVNRAGPRSTEVEDAVHALTDQFAERRKVLYSLFSPYISEANE